MMKAVKSHCSESLAIRRIILFLALALLWQGFHAGAMRAQTQDKAKTGAQTQPKDEGYIIGNLDRLSVTFWQQPDLNRDVRVDENGMISLPVIGDIKAAGLTPGELSKRIIQQMSIYNTPVSQATVAVTEFNSRSVVVSGHVLTPGSLRYEKIPDVWQVILDAGGPTSDADLSRVSIVRKEEGKSNIINVDLYKIIQRGDLSKAPQLQPGDLVNVPPSTFGGAMSLPTQPQFAGRNIFFVFGEVTEQGPRNLEDGMDILDGIALARGFTPGADLKNIRLIMKDARYSNVIRINMEKYTKTGRPPRLMLHPEDTIIVPTRGDLWHRTLTDLGTIVPILATTATLLVVIRDLQRNP
jgi:polysaccharide export outer membrane protein